MSQYIVISKVSNRQVVISQALPDLLSANRLNYDAYEIIDYSSIDAGDYEYDPLVDQTGLLIYNGGLIYPTRAANNSLFDDTFDDTFGGDGNRTYVGLFKYSDPSKPTLSQLTFSIDHTGSQYDFLTEGNSGGLVEMNMIRFEFLIKRTSGSTFGWYNPFADYNSPYGVAKTSLTRTGIVTKVSCTLSTIPRVSLNDLVLVRVIASSNWTNKIRNIKILNF